MRVPRPPIVGSVSPYIRGVVMTGEQQGSKWNGRNSAREQRGGHRGNDSEFVDLELSAKEKAALKDWCMDQLDLDAELQGVLADGAKITVREDERNRCWVAFAFSAEGSPNEGYILTGRGGSVSRALRQLAFKHHVLLDGDWASYHNRPGSGDEDDW